MEEISKHDQIKSHLLAGHRITVCSAAANYFTGDLRKYISRLRRSGLPILDEIKLSKNGRYKEYYMCQRYLKSIRERRKG